MTTINHETYCGQDLITLLLKVGFDWQDYFVAHDIDEQFHWEIPLHVAQRWLRETKDFHIFIEYDNSIYQCRIDQMEHIYYVKHREWLYNNAFNEFSTYEEAQEAGIKKALEIILKKGE